MVDHQPSGHGFRFGSLGNLLQLEVRTVPWVIGNTHAARLQEKCDGIDRTSLVDDGIFRMAELRRLPGRIPSGLE